MTKKDLFRIVFKLAGLYFIITALFNTLPSLTLFINNIQIQPLSLLLFAIVIILFGLFFAMLIFKPDVIINLLKLDKNFDNDFVTMNQPNFSNILQIGIIILGVFVIIKQLPSLITNLIFSFKLFVIDSGNDLTSQLQYAALTDYVKWGTQTTALLLAFLMIINSKAITRYIIKKNTQK